MSQITVTGKAGPGLTATAQVITNIREFTIRPGDAINAVGNANVLSITRGDGKIEEFAIDAATTCTATVAAGVWTVVIS